MNGNHKILKWRTIVNLREQMSWLIKVVFNYLERKTIISPGENKWENLIKYK